MKLKIIVTLVFILFIGGLSTEALAKYSFVRYERTIDISKSEGAQIILPFSVGNTGASTSSFNSDHITVCAETVDAMVNLNRPANSVWVGRYTATTARQLGSNSVYASNSGSWVVPNSFDVNNKIYCALKLDNNRSIARHNKGMYDLVIYSFTSKRNIKLTINAPSTVKLKDVSPNEMAMTKFTIRSLIAGGDSNEIFQGKLSWSLRQHQSNPSDSSFTISYNGTVGNAGVIPVSIANNRDYSFDISHRAIKPGDYKFFMDVVLSID